MSSISYIGNFESWRSSFKFSIPIKIRFSETDLYGHMNNTSVFIYFEEARIEYLDHLGLFRNFEKKKQGFVVADLQCDYLKPMYFNEKIDLYVKLATVGTSSIDLHYMAVNERNEVTVTGRGRLVMIDMMKNKSIPLPDSIKTILEQELDGQGELIGRND